jgi:hypothetical protein
MSSSSTIINGVEMANIKKVDGIDAPPVSVTQLADLDFTTMTSASWTGESTVSLSGQTWTIGNGGNSNAFGPNGSLLFWNPKGSSAGDWYSTSRTGPYLSIKLTDIDENFQTGGSAEYVIQVVCNEFPDGTANAARLMCGFWSDDKPDRGWTNLFGTQYFTGTPNLYCFMGGSNESRFADDGDELTFYNYLSPSGWNQARTSDAKDGNTPHGGTIRGANYCSPSDPQRCGSQGTLTLTASAAINVGIVAVGHHGVTTGPTYKVDRLRVWKLEAKQ